MPSFIARARQRITQKIARSEYIAHETKNLVLKKFFAVLAIVIAYFIFISFRYGVKHGFIVTLLTWSFFVLCTPICDAGLLLDFPIRLVARIRMIRSEIAVWALAITLNTASILFNPSVYETTMLLKLFKHILLNPVPFWSIIVLSCIGTFLSVYFGDELIDVARHEFREKYRKHIFKHRLIVVLFIITSVILLYYLLLKKFGIHLV